MAINKKYLLSEILLNFSRSQKCSDRHGISVSVHEVRLRGATDNHRDLYRLLVKPDEYSDYMRPVSFK